MDTSEYNKVKAQVEAKFGQLLEAFRKQDDTLEIPNIYDALITELTDAVVNEIETSREAEVELAEKNVKGAKKADWTAFKEERKKARIEAHKESKRYVYKQKDVEGTNVTVGVDPSEGIVS